MTPMKTLQERERELRTLMTPAGHVQLQELAARYAAQQRNEIPLGKSLITYILVCERELGLISV